MEEMENYNEAPEIKASAFSTALYYGLIGGVILSIWSVIAYMTNLQESAGWLNTIVSIVIFIAVIMMATKAHRDNKLGGVMSFGKGFSVGFLTVLIMAAIGAVFTIVYLQFIDPGVMQEAERQMEQQMAERDMSREEMEQALKVGRMFIQPGVMALMGFVFNLILGAVVSLISAAIYQRQS